MPRTTPLSRRVTITGAPVHLGDVLSEESSSGIRLSIPKEATSSVWIGDKDVTPTTGDPYKPGTSTRLPTVSVEGWYAVTNGANVEVTLSAALGGNADNVEWGDAGGAGGGNVTGPAGEPLATEVTADRTADATEALASTIAFGGTPLVGQNAVGVVNVDPPPTFTAVPGAGETGEAFYLIGSILSTTTVSSGPGLTSNELLVSSSPGRLLGWFGVNQTIGDLWVRSYDIDTSPTNGSSAMSQGRNHIGILVPRELAGRPGIVFYEYPKPLRFSNGCYLVVEDQVDNTNVTKTASAGCKITAYYVVDP